MSSATVSLARDVLPEPRVSDSTVVGMGDLLVAVPDDEMALPCRVQDPDLWFAENPAELQRAKQLCETCPIKAACLAGALTRREPWGVWGGEIFERGAVIAKKRPRGRPRKTATPLTAGKEAAA
ncbi:WhiB family transcriptional regulator [Actinoalloteichus hymeniacidonis]|uniref:Transcriptional regulator WhiB n=1 Tax=Actinoalloteichus hymeniacidonis TaxID=340345 RepID=A0AAC9HM95_9PSEU|nr:WhiB family transcriptional regulator [Actinoalloteichus hymeniacidonis]AOS61808.1 Transcription factor WhiB-like protein [Actinoalloteichus hymeniacidonis]MBB5910173.1 WhiB family redox-sensing transcriptional regulator [Actinoalloteichus hymeniacidonis]